MSRTRSVGVDFGTTTSLVAEGVTGRQPHVYPIGRTTSWLPSLVGLDDAGHLRAGEDADALVAARVRRSIKRCITRREVEIRLDDGTSIEVDAAIRTLLAEVALRARQGIELGEEVTRLGCPAMWTGEQRQRLLDLAGAAGLPVSDHTLIDEPVAAGVAWVTHEMSLRPRPLRGKLLVFDMGGGTLDVALLDVYAEPGHVPEISVLSSWGVDEAGDSLDQAIADDFQGDLKASGVETGSLLRHRALLVAAATEAKLQLTRDRDTVVAVRGASLSLPPLRYTREQLEVAFHDQLARAELLVWAVLRGARVTHELQLSPADIRRLPKDVLRRDVDFVLLAGGMSRVPAVAKMMDRLFPGVDLHNNAGVAADQAIVAGLAETVAYERINLHRPPFDLVLEYADQGSLERIPVYDAYSPFYPPSFAMTRHVLYHEWRARSGELPRNGCGYLRIYTAAGQPVELEVNGRQGVIEVPFGHHPPAVIVHPNGRVLIVDGKKATTSFNVPRWPVIRGKDHAVLKATLEESSRPPVLDKPWMRDPLFLH